jgi:hypothetical protein
VEKQDAWGINYYLTSVWPGDLQSSFLEHMMMTGIFDYLIPSASAQEPRIKHPSREGKPFEEGCESIHLRLKDISTVLCVTIRLILSPEKLPAQCRSAARIGEEYVPYRSRDHTKHRQRRCRHAFSGFFGWAFQISQK